jgi:hypothetical protein
MSEHPKIKSFSELADSKNINKINDWSEYVEKLNRKNPAFVGEDSDLCRDFSCYVCRCSFIEHTDKFGNKSPFLPSFRYKPHKSNWRNEEICTACFYALQNPEFKYFSTTTYGYPGILTKYKSKEGWFYKDTRDLSDCDEEYQNPE